MYLLDLEQHRFAENSKNQKVVLNDKLHKSHLTVNQSVKRLQCLHL